MTNECQEDDETETAPLSSRNDSSEMALKDGNCNCIWIGDQGLEVRACGGCKKDVRLYRDDPIHWRNKHWHLRCAFEQAKSELAGESNR